MSLLACTDCGQPVSSEAFTCPTCGRPTRDRSYLTPTAQVVMGGLVLIACFAWPGLIPLVALAFAGRCIGRAGRSSRRAAYLAGALLIPLTVGLMYVFPPQYAPVVVFLGAAGLAWLAVCRRRAVRAQPPLPASAAHGMVQ